MCFLIKFVNNNNNNDNNDNDNNISNNNDNNNNNNNNGACNKDLEKELNMLFGSKVARVTIEHSQKSELKLLRDFCSRNHVNL